MTEFQKKKLAFKKALNEGIEKVFVSGELELNQYGNLWLTDVRKVLLDLWREGDEVAVKVVDTYSALRNSKNKIELLMYTDRFYNNLKGVEDFEGKYESYFPGYGGDYFISRK